MNCYPCVSCRDSTVGDFLSGAFTVFGYWILQIGMSGVFSHEFYKKYLKVTAIVVAVAGPLFFLSSMKDWSEPARWTLSILSWNVDQSFEAPTTRFLSALTGLFHICLFHFFAD